MVFIYNYIIPHYVFMADNDLGSVVHLSVLHPSVRDLSTHAFITILPWILWSFVRIKFKMANFLFAQIDIIFENFVRPDEYLQHQWILFSRFFAHALTTILQWILCLYLNTKSPKEGYFPNPNDIMRTPIKFIITQLSPSLLAQIDKIFESLPST